MVPVVTGIGQTLSSKDTVVAVTTRSWRMLLLKDTVVVVVQGVGKGCYKRVQCLQLLQRTKECFSKIL